MGPAIRRALARGIFDGILYSVVEFWDEESLGSLDSADCFGALWECCLACPYELSSPTASLIWLISGKAAVDEIRNAKPACVEWSGQLPDGTDSETGQLQNSASPSASGLPVIREVPDAGRLIVTNPSFDK